MSICGLFLAESFLDQTFIEESDEKLVVNLTDVVLYHITLRCHLIPFSMNFRLWLISNNLPSPFVALITSAITQSHRCCFLDANLKQWYLIRVSRLEV